MCAVVRLTTETKWMTNATSIVLWILYLCLETSTKDLRRAADVEAARKMKMYREVPYYMRKINQVPCVSECISINI